MDDSRYGDLAELERRFNDALDRRAVAEGRPGVDGGCEAVARDQLRWAVWCIESLRELRDLADMTDARGNSQTPQGYRLQPSAMGHVIRASTTAVGAIDRVAAAFGAIHLGIKPNGQVHDFRQLERSARRGGLPAGHPVVSWLKDVRADAVFGHLDLLRDPLVHRTTPMALHGRIGGEPHWEDRPAHQDAPGFYVPGTDGRLDPTYSRSFTVVELLDAVTPSALRHVEAAVGLVESGRAFP